MKKSTWKDERIYSRAELLAAHRDGFINGWQSSREHHTGFSTLDTAFVSEKAKREYPEPAFEAEYKEVPRVVKSATGRSYKVENGVLYTQDNTDRQFSKSAYNPASGTVTVQHILGRIAEKARVSIDRGPAYWQVIDMQDMATALDVVRHPTERVLVEE